MTGLTLIIYMWRKIPNLHEAAKTTCGEAWRTQNSRCPEFLPTKISKHVHRITSIGHCLHTILPSLSSKSSPARDSQRVPDLLEMTSWESWYLLHDEGIMNFGRVAGMKFALWIQRGGIYPRSILGPSREDDRGEVLMCPASPKCRSWLISNIRGLRKWMRSV